MSCVTIWGSIIKRCANQFWYLFNSKRILLFVLDWYQRACRPYLVGSRRRVLTQRCSQWRRTPSPGSSSIPPYQIPLVSMVHHCNQWRRTPSPGSSPNPPYQIQLVSTVHHCNQWRRTPSPVSRVLTIPSIPDTNTIGKYIRGAVKFNPECVNNRILVHITR